MRSRVARQLAEQALAALVVELGSNASKITVIGGLNADLLTEPHAAAPHQGTVDVDVLLEVGFVWERQDELDFAWLEGALHRAHFAQVPGGDGWRWQRSVDGAPVKLELLCDTPDNRGQVIALPGCIDVSANNLQGPAAAQRDETLRRLPGHGAGSDSIEVAFAGLGGFLIAKAAAYASRRFAKDLYDWMYVVLNNSAGGPEAAATAIAQVLEQVQDAAVGGDVLSMLEHYASAEGVGAQAYALQRRDDGESDDVAMMAQDAVAAALIVRRGLLPLH